MVDSTPDADTAEQVDQISIQEIVEAMAPEGRLHFEIGQLRVAVNRLQAENARLREDKGP